MHRPGAATHQDDTVLDAAGVAWHYGQPLGEQRAVETTGAVIDRSQRRFLKVSGPEAATFLNNLLSQKLDDVTDGFHASTLDLDGQGHVLHHADISRVGEDFYLDVPESQHASLEQFLQRMIFWSQVEITSPELALVTVLGGEQSFLAPEFAWTVTPLFVRRSAWGSTARVDLAFPLEDLAQGVSDIESTGVQLAGLMAFTAERVRALEPELGADLDAKSIPHEVPHWIGRGDHPGAVHLEKGCYRGQETVARVENLGRSPRLLVLLHLDGSAPSLPAIGDEITANGRRIGRVGTIVDDCDYGPIALALVKRSALDHGDLLIGDTAAQIDADSVITEEGSKAGRAAIDKLRGR